MKPPELVAAVLTRDRMCVLIRLGTVEVRWPAEKLTVLMTLAEAEHLSAELLGVMLVAA